MRKCPYCAEEIQDNAIFCRYCRKRVRGVPIRRIIIFGIIIALAYFATAHKENIRRAAFNARLFISDLSRVWETFKEVLDDMKDGFTFLAEHKRNASELTGEAMPDRAKGGKR